MKKIILIMILTFIAGCSSSQEATVSEEVKIEHKYFNVGDRVTDYIADYTINRIVVSDLKSKDGFNWSIFDIDFYYNSNGKDDDYLPTCFLVNKDRYFEGYSQNLSIPVYEKVNTKVLFEIPDNQKEFDFYCDYSFMGSNSHINDESRSIVKINLNDVGGQ